MRYIDADFLIEQLQPAKNSVWNKNDHSKSMSEMIEDFCTELKNAPTADVVPKSEVENIFAEIETCMKDFEDDDDGYLLKKCEFEFFMREIKEKYARQKNG